MKTKTYSIFGAGAAGLYTAWRLLNGEPDTKARPQAKFKDKQLVKGDTLELFEWGDYDYNKDFPGTREPGARVCTWHYKEKKENAYLEVGGMRYSYWNGNDDPKSPGHRLVTKVIEKLGLDKYSIPFNESTNPLFCLRATNRYLNDINSSNPAPYKVNNYGADVQPDNGFGVIENLAALNSNDLPQTRNCWYKFYQEGKIAVDMPESSVFKKGDHFKDIGYWNLMYDQLGSEGFNYTADGNGYSSNVINWNAAVAIDSNNEFTPGNEYRTLSTGYSSMFKALFGQILALAKKKGVHFKYHKNTRLHSILYMNNEVRYSVATRKNPDKRSATFTCDAAWLAMPRHSIELVARATRYEDHKGRGVLDVLNQERVQLYLESAILQPSYKVGMFFNAPWWTSNAPSPPMYPAKLTSYELTNAVIAELKKRKEVFPPNVWDNNWNKIQADAAINEQPFDNAHDFTTILEQKIQERLTYKQQELLLAKAERNTIGPSITDMPIRQVVYFGNNAIEPAKASDVVYGLLASYDDEMYTSFWEELELGPNEKKEIPNSADLQTLRGPKKAPAIMVKMLRQQLAALHFGPQADYRTVPEPVETRYMDWSLPPFNAGYHAYAAHYDIGDVQRKIRRPSLLTKDADKEINIFIVGETYSNDQAWVEGAYCTAESVLNDFFGITPLINKEPYPFICPEKLVCDKNKK